MINWYLLLLGGVTLIVSSLSFGQRVWRQEARAFLRGDVPWPPWWAWIIARVGPAVGGMICGYALMRVVFGV